MKYEHPTIQCETPAPGHYLISGHAPRPVLLEAGYLVPPGTVHITPELPSALLRAILEDRGEGAGPESGTGLQPVAEGAGARREGGTAGPANAQPKPKVRRQKRPATTATKSTKAAKRTKPAANIQPEAH